MSTRGLIGIKKGGKLKAQFNRSDSYPEGLGVQVLEELCAIKRNRVAALNQVYDRIELVDSDDPVPEDQWARYDPSDTWGEALASCEKENGYASLTPYINGTVIHMVNEADFLKDRLFCEYSYIVNLDSEKLEVYRCGDLVQAFQLDRLPQEGSFLAQVRIGEVQLKVREHVG